MAGIKTIELKINEFSPLRFHGALASVPSFFNFIKSIDPEINLTPKSFQTKLARMETSSGYTVLCNRDNTEATIYGMASQAARDYDDVDSK